MSFLSKMNFFSRKTKPDQTYWEGRRWWNRGKLHVSDETAMKVSAYYRGVIYIATQIAKLPWNIKDKDNNVQSNQVSYLLNIRPNKETTAMKFKISMIVNAINKGNSYAEIERDGAGRPIALWPLNCDTVCLWRDPGTQELYYKVDQQNGGGTVYLDIDDVLHFPNLHVENSMQGMGVVQWARETLGISAGADRMAGNLFANGGLPSGFLKTPQRLSPEAYDRLKNSWKQDTSGENSGGTALLEEGVDFSPIEVDAQILQFLESRKFGVIEICRFLGLPPTKLFDTSAATYSNTENSNLEVATDTLDAWACNLENEVDVKLLNGQFAGRYCEIDLYSVFRGDMKARSDYFKAMISIGAITPNEIRDREGMAPYADGKSFYISTNNLTPADRVNDVIDAQIKGKTAAPAAKPDDEVDPAAEPDNKKLTKALIHRLEKANR